MAEKILRATHQGQLTIGKSELQCAVLEDGTRIISRNAIFRAFGRTKRGRKKDEIRVLNMPSFIDANNLQSFIGDELRDGLKLIKYQALNGKIVAGYNAKILPLICDVYLSARARGELTKHQLPLAQASEILIRSFAHVGIIALVDEATGYQEVRDRLALQQILEAYISEELLRWTKTFPDEFYKELFRLKNWQYSPLKVARPGVVGRLTNDIVYQRLAPGVLEELRRKNPITESGYRKHKHHQWLTEDIGHPALAKHLHAVIALMKASPNYQTFSRLLERAFPKLHQTLPLPFPDEDMRDHEELEPTH